jgi:hypothetical protein
MLGVDAISGYGVAGASHRIAAPETIELTMFGERANCDDVGRSECTFA